jgi:hypothetical protein
MKKLAIAGVSVALMLAVAVPAFASVKGHDSKDNGSSVTVVNKGDASNQVLTVANTGLNIAVAPKTESKKAKGGSVNTGDAVAVTVAGNVVGTTYVSTCNTCNTGKHSNGGSDVKVTNSGDAYNGVVTVANTGVNYSSGSVQTGDAAAGSLLVNVVGTTIVK